MFSVWSYVVERFRDRVERPLDHRSDTDDYAVLQHRELLTERFCRLGCDVDAVAAALHQVEVVVELEAALPDRCGHVRACPGTEQLQGEHVGLRRRSSVLDRLGCPLERLDGGFTLSGHLAERLAKRPEDQLGVHALLLELADE